MFGRFSQFALIQTHPIISLVQRKTICMCSMEMEKPNDIMTKMTDGLHSNSMIILNTSFFVSIAVHLHNKCLKRFFEAKYGENLRKNQFSRFKYRFDYCKADSILG